MKSFTIFIAFLSVLWSGFVFSEEGDVVIINSNENQSQSVTAPALTPSKASELRKAREDAEVSTETYILEKLEAGRLKDEQERVDKLMGGSQSQTPVIVEEKKSLPAPEEEPKWHFGEKTFVSLGGGYVKYLGPRNVESTIWPAFFISLGGYAEDYFIFDFTGYYSTHFITDKNKGDLRVQQISGALSLKFSPLKGKLKPYAGVVGAYTTRRYQSLTAYGEVMDDPYKRIGTKEWQQAFDVGPTLGVDVALGPRLGFNVGVWWLFNVYTEELDETPWADDEGPLSEIQSFVISGNVRFYF